MDYPSQVTTRTEELNTVKINLINVLSTINAKYMTMDFKDFYLNTPMMQKEYRRLKVEFILKVFMDKYNLWDMVENGHVHDLSR